MESKVLFILLVFCSINLICGEKTSLENFFRNNLDINKDGELDYFDLRKYTCVMDDIWCSPHTSFEEIGLKNQIEYSLSRMDKDSSKSVSWEEFSSHFLKESSPFHSFKDPILPGPQQIHLMFTEDPSHEMLVMWVTREKTDSVVKYGLNSQSYTFSANGTISTYNCGVDGWSGWIHTVFLKNLSPSTTYYYIVGSEDDWSDEYHFKTVSQEPAENLVFATMGDMGTFIPMGWAVTDRMIDGNRLYNFTAVLHLGDVCYAGTGSEWEFEEIWDIWGNQVQDLAAYVPYMITIGNHEHYYNFTSYRSRFLMPGVLKNYDHYFWWSLQIGNIYFISMSTEHPYDHKSKQYEWLVSELIKAGNSTAKWIIVMGHRPMYSSDTDEWNAHRPGAYFQTVIEPLFIKYHVDVYLCGHQHMYERVYPVVNGTVKQKGNEFKNPGATIHVNQATGGVFTDLSYIDPQPDWSAARNSEWGYGKFSASNTVFHYEFIHQDSGEIVDQFTLTKSP